MILAFKKWFRRRQKILAEVSGEEEINDYLDRADTQVSSMSITSPRLLVLFIGSQRKHCKKYEAALQRKQVRPLKHSNPTLKNTVASINRDRPPLPHQVLTKSTASTRMTRSDTLQ